LPMTTSRRRSNTRLHRIDLYPSENVKSVSLKGVRSYLQGLLPRVDVKIRGNLLRHQPRTEMMRLAEGFARARVKNPAERLQKSLPFPAEIDYELRALGGSARVGGVVYDGRIVQEILMNTIAEKASLDAQSIVFTDRLVSTFSGDDLRHHLRYLVCGFPCIISIPGIVEAPARPREYYLLKQQIELEGGGDLRLEQLKSNFRGRFLDYGDPRIAEVLKGLSLQSVAYHTTLEPFCDVKSCRLFNAHWQEELIRSQIIEGKLCRKHAPLFRSLGKSPVVAW